MDTNLEEIERLKKVLVDIGSRAWKAAGRAADAREILSTLVYWHDQGHIDESWWDAAKDLLKE